jgi:hypothetical protein
MFVEPRPGSGFDKIAPAYLVRSLLGRLFGRNDQGEAETPVRQESTATPATEPGRTEPVHLP